MVAIDLYLFYLKKNLKNFLKEHATKKNLLVVTVSFLIFGTMFFVQIMSYKYTNEVYNQNIFSLLIFMISLLIINVLAVLGLVKNQLFSNADRHYFFSLSEYALSSLFFVCLKKSMVFILLFLQMLYMLPTIYYSFKVTSFQIILFYLVVLLSIVVGYLLRIKLFLLQSSLLKYRSYLFYFLIVLSLMVIVTYIFRFVATSQNKMMLFIVMLSLVGIFLFVSICKHQLNYYEHESHVKLKSEGKKNIPFFNMFLSFSGAKVLLTKQIIEQQRKYGFLSFFILAPFYLFAFILALFAKEFYLTFLLIVFLITFYANVYVAGSIDKELNTDVYELIPDDPNKKALYVVLRHSLIVFINSFLLSIMASIFTNVVAFLVLPFLLFLLDITCSLVAILLRKKYYLILPQGLLFLLVMIVKGMIVSLSLIPMFLSIQADSIFKLVSLLSSCLFTFFVATLILKKINNVVV